MNKILSCCLIILLFLSCVNKENTNSKEKNVTKTLIDSSQIKSVTTKSFEIDTSKLTKAFDNIYFGENKDMFESHLGKSYSIANIYFSINSGDRDYLQTKIDEKYGLYQFLLVADYDENYYSICLDDIQLVKSVIDRKYSKPSRIFSPPAPKKYSALQKFEIKIIKPKAYPPPDNGYTNFLYKWNRKDVTIKAGLRTEYNSKNVDDENPKFDKSYRLVLEFTSDKIKKNLTADINKSNIEYNKKLKEKIKNDAVKF